MTNSTIDTTVLAARLPCPFDGCGRRLRNQSGLANHARIKHGGLPEPGTIPPGETRKDGQVKIDMSLFPAPTAEEKRKLARQDKIANVVGPVLVVVWLAAIGYLLILAR